MFLLLRNNCKGTKENKTKNPRLADGLIMGVGWFRCLQIPCTFAQDGRRSLTNHECKRAVCLTRNMVHTPLLTPVGTWAGAPWPSKQYTFRSKEMNTQIFQAVLYTFSLPSVPLAACFFSMEHCIAIERSTGESRLSLFSVEFQDLQHLCLVLRSKAGFAQKSNRYQWFS